MVFDALGWFWGFTLILLILLTFTTLITFPELVADTKKKVKNQIKKLTAPERMV